MTKHRIIFLSSKNPLLTKDWSGIPFYLFKALSATYEVEYVPLPTFRDVKKLGYYFSKFFFLITGKRYVFDYGVIMALLYGFWGIFRFRKSKDIKFIFSPAGLTETAFLQTSLPIVSYGDCSTLQLIDYYPALTNVSKLSEREIKFVEQRALKRISLPIFSSDWASRFVQQKFKKECFTIPFGANINLGDDRRSDTQKILSHQTCNLLFIGVDWIRKGGDVALKIHKKLLDKGITSTLTIVGTTIPENVECPAHVEVIPYLNKDTEKGSLRFKELFDKSNLLLLPTLADCTPIVIAESYANAVPVLATYTGGLPTMIKEHETGYMFETGDVDRYVERIEYLIKNDAVYYTISQNCLRYYNNLYNWKSFTSSLSQLATQFY